MWTGYMWAALTKASAPVLRAVRVRPPAALRVPRPAVRALPQAAAPHLRAVLQALRVHQAALPAAQALRAPQAVPVHRSPPAATPATSTPPAPIASG